jgi:hypothetical protein
VVGPDEWQAAPVHVLDLNMIRMDPLATETRPCELRVMNSANALYIALKIPDLRKYDLMPTRNAFLDPVTTGNVDAAQLTTTKLERLMNRYVGKEWLPSRLKHLDFPEAERTDVVRGLRTCVLAGPANARRFAELYAQLPAARRVLGPDVVKDLEAARALR